MAMWEADVRLRQAKLASRQQMEGEGLLQRGGRARDELELRRGEEVARQANRCGAALMDLAAPCCCSCKMQALGPDVTWSCNWRRCTSIQHHLLHKHL